MKDHGKIDFLQSPRYSVRLLCLLVANTLFLTARQAAQTTHRCPCLHYGGKARITLMEPAIDQYAVSHH